MAKAKDDETTGTDLAVFSKTGLPSTFSEQEMDYTGDLGYSLKAEDTLVPIVSILQDNSAEVKRQHAKYIDGAMAGDLIIRAFKRVIKVDKDNPFVFQPCGFTHAWVQWRGEPGEGQVIKQYPFDDRPTEAIEKPDPQSKPGEERMFWAMPNGDRLVDTRYHYGHALLDGSWVAVVVPMSGTNHTVSRQWTGQMKAIKFPNGRAAPAWFRAWSLRPTFQSRGAQSWFNYTVDDLGWITDADQRRIGQELNETLASGELTPVEDAAETAAPAHQDEDAPV